MSLRQLVWTLVAWLHSSAFGISRIKIYMLIYLYTLYTLYNIIYIHSYSSICFLIYVVRCLGYLRIGIGSLVARNNVPSHEGTSTCSPGTLKVPCFFLRFDFLDFIHVYSQAASPILLAIGLPEVCSELGEPVPKDETHWHKQQSKRDNGRD